MIARAIYRMSDSDTGWPTYSPRAAYDSDWKEACLAEGAEDASLWVDPIELMAAVGLERADGETVAVFSRRKQPAMCQCLLDSLAAQRGEAR